jgi:hypothetical protein
MTATHYRLGHAGAAADLEGSPEDDFAGARRRLALAVLWLAGLIAWGLFSYVSEPPVASQGDRPVRAEQPLDGHGKWTGQTAGWRSRSQVLQDAGVVGRD